ncbi:MAG: D-2-hydroxyacid dehydrogenase family protein [Alphaproteobacteria bacterium]|nr:D-2-hydroxyacid dehydrogenase family protein [Alphaproteobacteria bacterium]
MTRVAILDDYLKIALASADWESLPNDVTIDVFHDHLTDEAALVDRLHPYDVLVIMRERTPFRRSLVEKLPNLKLLASTSGRNKGIDLEACADNDVLVCHTERGHTPTAELTWGLILALAKKIPEEHAGTRDGAWGVAVGEGLAGKVLGVLGLGLLGAKVAAVGQLFDMDVIAWSQNLTAERAAECGVARVEKNELFERSDYLSVHVVLGDRTRGLVGADELARMKPTAYLINTSRGPIVDEAALVSAVQNGVIAGAGLDVYGTEPLPADDPLRTLPNSVITPHTGGFVRENYKLWYGGAVENIHAWLDGKPIRILTDNN